MAVRRVRRLVGNFASLFSSEVVSRATTFVLYTLVSRTLGAFAFGQLSLALTLFFIFQVFAGAGLRMLVTREVARDRTKTDQVLVNGSAIVVVCSLLSLIGLLLFVRLMGYSRETASVVLLVALGVLPFSLSTINEAVFQAWERMSYIARANVPVHVAKVGLAFLLLWQGYGLFELILLLLASHGIILALEWWLMLRHITRPRVRINLHVCMSMVRATSPFLGMTAVVAINTSLDLLLLSKLATETDVGFYNAALQLIAIMIVVYQNIVLSVFPEMCRRFAAGVQGLKQISEHVLELLLAIALPATVGLSFLAEAAFLLLYGNADFLQASPGLRVLAWTLPLWASTHVLGRALVAGLREKVTLRIAVLTTILKLAFGLILISRFGLLGAAVSALLSAIVDSALHYVSAYRLLFRLPVAKLAWKPALASACMAAYLALLGNRSVLFTVVSAGAVYAVILMGLMIWSNGGPRRLKAKYQYLLSR